MFPNLAARASGDGRMAQRGWRIEIMRSTSVLPLISSEMRGVVVEAARECEVL